MNAERFFLYVGLPALTLLFIFTSRFYYSKKNSPNTRFYMPEGVFVGNIVAPFFGLLSILGIYSSILNFKDISFLRWEILAIFSITLLSFIIGIGIGAHIVALLIEKSLENSAQNEKTKDTLYFFHWPFGHKMTYVPATLIFHILTLLDVFKGVPYSLNNQEIILTIFFAIIFGATMTFIFIVTHVTRIMFYTLLITNFSLLYLYILENVNFKEHLVALFFSFLSVTMFFLISIYRYIHKASKNMHSKIHSRFPNGDKVLEDD
jgi:hypothetical protein